MGEREAADGALSTGFSRESVRLPDSVIRGPGVRAARAEQNSGEAISPPHQLDIPSESQLQVPVRRSLPMPSRSPSLAARAQAAVAAPPWHSWLPAPLAFASTEDLVRRPRSHIDFVGASRGSAADAQSPELQHQRQHQRQQQPQQPQRPLQPRQAAHPTAAYLSPDQHMQASASFGFLRPGVPPLAPQGDGACAWSDGSSEGGASSSRSSTSRGEAAAGQTAPARSLAAPPLNSVAPTDSTEPAGHEIAAEAEMPPVPGRRLAASLGSPGLPTAPGAAAISSGDRNLQEADAPPQPQLPQHHLHPRPQPHQPHQRTQRSQHRPHSQPPQQPRQSRLLQQFQQRFSRQTSQPQQHHFSPRHQRQNHNNNSNININNSNNNNSNINNNNNINNNSNNNNNTQQPRRRLHEATEGQQQESFLPQELDQQDAGQEESRRLTHHLSAPELSSWQVAEELSSIGGMAAPRYLLVRLGECIPAETGAAPVHRSRLDSRPQWRDFLNFGAGHPGGVALEEMLTCPCCLNIFRQPIALPCGHTLCRGCYVRVCSQPSSGRRCPLCRADLPRFDLRVNVALAAVSDALRSFQAVTRPRAGHWIIE